MTLLEALGQEAAEGRTLWLLAVFFVTVVLVRAFAGHRPPRLKSLGFLVGVHLLCLLIAAALHTLGSSLYTDFRLPGVIAGGIAFVGCAAALLFTVALPRVRLETSRILQDVIVALASVITGVTIASRTGVNLSGLIATSAVFTAVLGFSLQDIIGNVAGGLALQVDNSLTVGDWVKLGDLVGKVTEVRWRYTALETRNWETVLVPNAQIVKSQVMLLGHRHAQPVQWRRWVYFNVDYRFQPTDVIECVTTALKVSQLERVAANPAPNCVLMQLGESFGSYAVRYWLTDLAVDDPTDSNVRTVIFFALQRAGMRLSIPAHAIFLTEKTADRAATEGQLQLDRRLRLLESVGLFGDLTADEKAKLARGLRHTPFARGEVMTRQGAEAHWLYLLEEGVASVRVSEGGVAKEVAPLHGPVFFGEMSLMTGEPRSATVMAVTDAECFRLDSATFREVLQARPELAEKLAAVLARRRAELVAAREGVSAEAKLKQIKKAESDLLEKMRRFFHL